MRERLWSAPRPATGRVIERPDVTVEAIGGLELFMVSGDLTAALSAFADHVPLLGLGALAHDGSYAARIARDRALVVGASGLAAEEGWRDGYAATRMDDGWATLDLSGPGAAEAIAEGTAADLDGGSPSAATLFVGVTALLLRRPRGFRLHVEACWREAVLERLARD